MRILVVIGDQQKLYEFDSYEIFIGAAKQCDICLKYKGVGQNHLRIFEKNQEYFIEELNSGFSTLLNNQRMKPNSIARFNSFLPLEIGGIIISIQDEVIESDEEVSIPDTDNILDVDARRKLEDVAESQASIDESIVRDISKKFEQEHGKEREKFKPNLYEGKGSEQEFKITKKKVRKKRRKKVARSTSIKSKNNRRKISARKTRKVSPFQRFGLGTITVIGLFLIAAAFVFYKKQLKSIATEKRQVAKVVDTNFQVAASRLDIVEQNKNYFRKRVNQGGCSVKQELCEFFFNKSEMVKPEGVYLVDNVLEVFLTQFSARAFEKKLKYSNADLVKVKEFVSKNYSSLFTLEEFEKNNNVSPIASNRILRDDFQYSILLLHKVLDVGFLDLLKRENIQNMKIHIFEREDDRFIFSNYVEITTESIEYNISKVDSINSRLKMLYLSNLSFQFKEFIKMVATFNNEAFDSTEVDRYMFSVKMTSFKSLLELEKCSLGEIYEICEEFRSKDLLGDQKHDGVSIADGKLIMVINLSRVISRLKELYKGDYNSQQKKKMISTYRKVNRERGNFYRDFKDNDYVETRLQQGTINGNTLVSVLFGSSLVGEIQKNESITEIKLFGYDESVENLKTVLEFKRDAFLSLKPGTMEDEIKMFWRSNLDTFTRFIKDNSTSTIGF